MALSFIQHLLEHRISEDYAENNQQSQRLLDSVLGIFGQASLGQDDEQFLKYLEHTYEDILTPEGMVHALGEIMASRENPGHYDSEYTGAEEEESILQRAGRNKVKGPGVRDTLKGLGRKNPHNLDYNNKRRNQMKRRTDRSM